MLDPFSWLHMANNFLNHHCQIFKRKKIPQKHDMLRLEGFQDYKPWIDIPDAEFYIELQWPGCTTVRWKLSHGMWKKCVIASCLAVGKVSTGIQCIWIGMVGLGEKSLGFQTWRGTEHSGLENCCGTVLIGWLGLSGIYHNSWLGWSRWASMVGRFYHKSDIFICWDGPSGRIR